MKCLAIRDVLATDSSGTASVRNIESVELEVEFPKDFDPYRWPSYSIAGEWRLMLPPELRKP